MSLLNCNRCGKLIIQKKQPYCDSCLRYYDHSYRQIRDCLHTRPHLTAYDVHRETGVPLSVVLELIRSS
ncbi:hypothetical protein [Gorillibacterium sp. CAU 1737]|uniref:hypothetical protein n=1 Tax=Gorillibacterium sp. CAU 1737 TaxID=3140362 RepID=UPI003260B0DF